MEVKKYISITTSLLLFVLYLTYSYSATARDFVSNSFGLNEGDIQVRREVYNKNFRVFDGTQYLNKPNFKMYGISPFKVVYESEMWGNKNNYARLPNKYRIKSVVNKLPSDTDFIVINIEHWPLTGFNDKLIDSSLSKYQKVVSWYKKFSPELKIGFYARPPMPDYWRAIDANPKKRRVDWMAENDRINLLADSVDALYPSLYTFYTNKSEWVKFAKAQIMEARRLANGKPVFAFLWPQYHDSNLLLGCQFLPGDYWQLQLDTVKSLADGLVIWGGWDVCNKKGKALRWDDSAEWWEVTKNFLLENPM